MAEFAHNSWRHKHTKHTLHELLIGINPTASITIPEDRVSAAQERLKMLKQARTNAQQSLQKCIKPIVPPRTFVLGDKVWLDT